MRARLRRGLKWALGAVVVLTLYTFWWEPSSFTIRREQIALTGLHQPLTVAAISDLHVGAPYVGLAKIRDIVSQINNQHPDLIVLLGDFVIGGQRHSQGVLGGTFVQPEPIAQALHDLRAPLGVYAVIGNHDGWYDTARVTAALEREGILVLRNTATPVDADGVRLWIAGLADLWTDTPDITAALAPVPAQEPVILLAHNPDSFPDVPSRVTLFLAGHTHGNQANLPMIGPIVSVSRRGYRDGLVREGQRTMFITHGLGTSTLPGRILATPEAALLRLVPLDLLSEASR